MKERNIDYSSRDYEGFKKDLLSLLKAKIPEYTDFSESDAGMVLIDLLAHGLDVISYYNDVVANEVFMDTARSKSSIINLASQIGYTVSNASASKFEQVFEIVPQEEPYVIPAGTVVSTRGDESEKEIEFELEEDLIIPAGKTGTEKLLEDYLYKGIVRQGTTVYEEVIGTSTGAIDQSFQLGYANVLDSSIYIYVNEGTEWVTWSPVDNFLDSERLSRDYMLKVNERDETSVIFGNDISGMIPPKYQNGILATYVVGGGEEGNVAPNRITEMPQKPPEIIRTFNPYEPREFGREREPNHLAKLRATSQLKTLWRAVTIFDFEDTAFEFDFTRFSRAIERPVPEGEHCIAKVDVYILTYGRETLSTRELEGLQELYNQRKLLGVDVHIHSPIYRVVDFDMFLKTVGNYTDEEVISNIETYLKSKFELGMIDFGTNIYLSELIGEMMQLDGVRSVAIDSPLSDVEVEPNEIVRLGNMNITTTEGGAVL